VALAVRGAAVRLPGVIRLICSDVDGTLVGASGRVAPEVWSAADRARAAGVHLALCSGRPAFGATRALAERFSPDGWHIFQNGASVLHLPTGRTLSEPLGADVVAGLVARARASGRPLEVYTDVAYAVERDVPATRQHAGLLGLPFAPRPFEELPAARVVRAQWVLPDAEAAAVRAEPHPGLELAASTSPLMPGVTFLNLTRQGVDKGSAVRRLAAELGVPLAEVMMVGDSHNDVGALRAVGLPVAMANAEPEVRAVARAFVGHVDAGGAAEAFALALARPPRG
jgi:Cof subfamily protein (haloacid dehalogenase superfamily)